MNYICKNCGAFISEEEFKKEQDLSTQAMGCGCFLWIIILLCFVSVILIPIAIILLFQLYSKTPAATCPYCNSPNSLIPETSPVAKKMIEENFTQDQKDEISKIHNKQQIKYEQEQEECQKNKGIGLGCLLVIVIIVILNAIFH